MDTLSTSVSSLKAPGLPTTAPRETFHFRSPHTPFLLPHYHHLSTHRPNSTFNKPSLPFTSKSYKSPFLPSSQPSSLRSPSPVVHRKAASGYAAALMDRARCSNVLEAVEHDVRRFSRLFHSEHLRAILNDPFVDDKTKGEEVKQVVEKGRFQKHLAVLLKMMIEKNKMGMVNEVLQEFQRIYDELSGTRIVLVSSARKMEEDQLFGIAKRVQSLSGAMKIKVRHLIDESLSSSAL
ncbi:PREDICTED: ATP synthase delta chain, chloroplastic [Nelumbo nucifera]|uniref:ATP synthase delta chain, chloroplastic n=1 Tax=Nelumbo nucifera TaxID=4432 RepID=A0A1U8AIG8_NELNU|nr:PREDICTED: ATP synthase delta chain, chloroplastic [Nelumbo nucifera]